MHLCLWFVTLATPLLVSTRTWADEELEDEFRDLFDEMFRTPGRRGSKHARDTSRAGDSSFAHLEVHPSHGRPAAARSSKPRETVDDATQRLSPLFNCDHFDESGRLCVHLRQLGTTLTLGVRLEGTGPVHWYRIFHVRGQDQKLSFLEFTKEAIPWNINIGGNHGNELRISPVSETDFGPNFFLATLGPAPEKKASKKPLLMFRIEPLPIELGPLYHGEEIAIGVRSHVELPPTSVQYEWSRVRGDFELVHNLPSNVRLSRDGSAILVKEYSSERDMLVTCTIYSNKNVTVARRNFLLSKIVPAVDPNHSERIRKRRFLDAFYLERGHGEEVVKREVQEEHETTPADATLEFAGPHTTPRQTDVYGDGASKESESLQDEEADDVIDSQRQDDDVIEPQRQEQEEEGPSFEDRESMLIADCNLDSECGVGAACVRSSSAKRFCKCRQPRFNGNGIFCWPL